MEALFQGLGEKLVSGKCIRGTRNVSELAERLTTENFWRGGHCGIAIANQTDYRLIAPQRYIKYGHINSTPMFIEPGTTGLITAAKTIVVPVGTEGVITYEIETTDNEDVPYYTRFQLMWQAPFYISLADNKVNVALGTWLANEDLFDKMSTDRHGELVRARNTVHVYKLDHGFNASVYMGEKGPCPLAITLTRVASSANSEGSTKKE